MSRINHSATEGWPFHRRAAAAAPPDWTRARPLFEEITMTRPTRPPRTVAAPTTLRSGS